jgi:peptide/nickel transport system substrate-binding protein
VNRRILWHALAAGATAACLTGAGRAERRGATVLYASGADLQSINPLHTVHPLAKQVQRYVLLTTLARYDSALVARPYLARSWFWSGDHRTLTIRLHRGVRWHDGRPTTAADVAWTLNAARNADTGYPRMSDLTSIVFVDALNDSTVTLRFAEEQPAVLPDVLTDLAVLPAHLLDTLPLPLLRRAAWNQQPVGNGPFRFVLHEPNRRWVFARNPDFPPELGGPPALERFIVVVVDEPTTKLAALTAGELDFAGIQPAHAEFVRDDPRLHVLDFPQLLTYAIVFNTRRAPFDALPARLAVALALDRQEIIDGYLFGFGRIAHGAVPPEVPGYVAPGRPVPTAPDSARALLGGRRVPFELLAVGSGEAALEQMIQARLAAVGFDVTIRQLELSAFLDRVYGPRREFDAAIMGIPGDLALGHLTTIAQLAGVRLPREPAAAQRALGQTFPAAFVYHARGVVAMNRRIENVRMDLRGDLPTIARWRAIP